MKKYSTVIFIVIVALLMGGTTIQAKEHQGIHEGKPRINAPQIVGNYPATPFLFYIPTAGERPMKWSVNELPQGLTLNNETGIISGTVSKEGNFKVKLTAKNSVGKDTQELIISIGDNLALTPPMGWNSWNTFGQQLTEALVLETADALIKNGMRELGYTHINIDDFWQLAERGKDGHIQINREKFPNGIKPVADYLHERGFKLGIYSDAADRTCGGVCGSYGYEETDAKDFAAWGVDLLKYDYCNAPQEKAIAIERYTAMGNALKNTGRSIVYNICEWGQLEPWTWAKKAGAHYWRTTFDIRDNWKATEYSYKDNGILNILDLNEPLAKYAAPGAWNDPDMLVVGIAGKSNILHATDGKKAGCAPEQYRSHMSLWAMMAAPLLCGNDVRNMDSITFTTLTNPDIIAINQDRAANQATRVANEADHQVWVKALADGARAIACLNLTDQDFDLEILLPRLKGVSKIHDVWENKETRMTGKYLKMKLIPYQCKVFILKK